MDGNDKIVTLGNLSRYNENIRGIIDLAVQKLMSDIPTVPTKVSAFENDSNYVSSGVVQQMIADTTANLHIYCTNNDILRLFDASIPEEPDTPVEPEVPTESVGSITDDNSIVIDETQLENGTYTLRYIDSNGNAIDNFNEITSFEINR